MKNKTKKKKIDAFSSEKHLAPQYQMPTNTIFGMHFP